jgi:SPASM domain peptide maturase of grasp-with-spasm system
MEEFKLFANCIIVRGVKRSTICDLQRNEVHFVPNAFKEILDSERIFTSSNLNAEIRACIDYCIENELGHFVKDVQEFPNLDLDYEYPGLASNAILEISERSSFNYDQVFKILSDLGVKFLEIRLIFEMNPDILLSLLQNIKTSKITDLVVFLKYSELWSTSKINELFIVCQRISALIFTSAHKDSTEVLLGRTLTFTTTELKNDNCGKIHPQYFSCNIKAFSESQRYNSCLNGKISITEEGIIKNCLSLKNEFGSINNPVLRDVIAGQSFQKFWNIGKDKINICKDCEFRHVCSDCRAFLDEPDDLYSKPLKCGYDPYSATWSDWAVNPLKKDAIEFYGLNHKVS